MMLLLMIMVFTAATSTPINTFASLSLRLPRSTNCKSAYSSGFGLFFAPTRLLSRALRPQLIRTNSSRHHHQYHHNLHQHHHHHLNHHHFLLSHYSHPSPAVCAHVHTLSPNSRIRSHPLRIRARMTSSCIFVKCGS